MRHVFSGSVRTHGRRYLASALAICLGVAFVAATLVVLTSSKAALTDAVAPQYERASYVVIGGAVEYTPEGGTPEAIEQIAEVRGVESVAGLATANPRLASSGASLPVATVPADPALRWQQLVSGRMPRAADEIVLESRLLEEYEVRVGDTLELSDGDERTWRVKIVGTTQPAEVAGAPAAYASNDALADWQGGAYADEILIRGSDVDADALAAAVRAAVPDAELLTAEQRMADVVAGLTRDLDIMGAFLIGFAAIAVFVAILVVANTFTVLLAQRVRELALLRCVGARRGQLLRSLLAEAGLLGFGASVVGVAIGYGLGGIALVLLGNGGIGLSGDTVRPAATAILIPIAVGVVATLVAALLPARRATLVPPLAALRPLAAVRLRSRGTAVRFVLAALLLAGGGYLLSVGFGGGEGAEILISVLGGALTFVGVLLLGPVVVPAVVRLQGLVVSAVRGRRGAATGRLAVANTLRNPRRTSVTAAALLVGVTLITIMTVGAESVRATLTADLDAQYPVDLTLAASAGPLPESVRTAVRDTPGVASTATLSALATDVTVADQSIQVLGADPDRLATVVRDDALAGEFGRGTALIGPMFADEAGLKDGDELILDAAGGRLEVRVRATRALAEVYGVVLAEDDLAALGRTRPSGAMWVQLADDADVRSVVDTVTEALPTEGSDAGSVMLGGGAPQRVFYDQVLGIMLLIAVGLLAIAVLIALVGVGNTLSLSVIERTQEHAVLRALGLRRGQLRGMVAVEAVLLAGAAVIIGVPLGTFYGWVGTSALLGRLSGDVTLAVPVEQVLLIVGIAVVAGLLASVLPARRAARVAPASALAETT